MPTASSSGPIHGQQLVIELVGPRSVPSESVKAILGPEWQRALASPEIYVMAGADSAWRPLLVTDASVAYDSVVLAWDLLTSIGEMSVPSAQTFWNASEDLARQLSRRALAMPIPADIPKAIRVLRELRESLDVGVNLSVTSGGLGFKEQDIWDVAQRLEMDCSPEGLFVSKSRTTGLALFEVSPIGDFDRYSLAQAQQSVLHEGLLLGFSIPLCPEPELALDSCIRAAQAFAAGLRGAVLDEDDRPLTMPGENAMRSNLGQAVGALKRAGLAPGSREALKLFGV